MKKRYAAVMAALLLTVTACGGREESGTIRLGVALYRQDDTFITSLSQDLQQAALEEEQTRGVKINLNIVDGREARPPRTSRWTSFWTGDTM